MNVTQVRSEGPINMPVSGALTASAGVTTGNPIYKNPLYAVFQLIATAASTVVIEVTADYNTFIGSASNWITLATLTTTAAGTDSYNSNAAWPYVRARITANSGTVNVILAG